MGSMSEEMKKAKRHLRASQTEKRKYNTKKASSHDAEQTSLSGAILPGRSIKAQYSYTRGDTAGSSPRRSNAEHVAQSRRVPKNTFQKPNGDAGKKTRDSLSRDKDLDGYAAQAIQLLDGGTHVVYVRRSGTTATDRTQAKPSSKAAASNAARAAPNSASTKKQTGQPVALERYVNPAISSFRLARLDEFKQPDDWVGLGGQVALSPTGKAQTVYMGIDFGTAYTKSSVGFGGDVFIVDWAGVNASPEKFVLPGEFSVLSDGSCLLGRSPHAIRVASNLKLPFLEGYASKNSLADASIFLALIMRYIRAWWFHRHSGLARHRSLEWNINLGAPTTSWQDNRLRADYERVAKAAWVLSLGNTPIGAEYAQAVLERGGLPNEASPPVEIVPEFVAQIASYTRSPQRQKDLHMLVDVGAGTVDVVTFNVHQDDHTGEDRFPIFSAAVDCLGTHYLMSRRFDACSQAGEQQWDDASSIPSTDQFSQRTGVALQEIRRVDNAHMTDVANTITSVLRSTKQQRYRRSPNWKAGIRVFLCGGGSSCQVFEQATATAARLSGVPLPRIRLPLPERLKAPGLSQGQFHRVSVAFGLGMDAFNLGQITAMSEIEDDTSISMPVRAHFDWDDG